MTYAPEWIIETKRGGGAWQFFYEAVCDEVVCNVGAKPSTAKIRLNGCSWHDDGGLERLDRVRVRTPGDVANSTLLFDGVLTAWTPNFSGQNENSVWFAQDLRYMFAKQNVIYGQWCFARSAYPKNAAVWKDGPPEPKDYQKRYFAVGRRCIFNKGGNGNKDPYSFRFNYDGETYKIPMFSQLSNAEDWTVGDMVQYVLMHITTSCCNELGYGPIANPDPDAAAPSTVGLPLDGMSETDPRQQWNYVPGEIDIDCLNAMEALEYLANLIGWKYRLDSYLIPDENNNQLLDVAYRHIFYIPNVATEPYTRTDNDSVLLRRLYCPSYNGPYSSEDTYYYDDLSAVLAADEIVVNAANIIRDGSNVINRSCWLGEQDMHEISVELVPAWKDSDFTIWAVGDADKLFYTSSELKDLADAGVDPNSKTFVKKFCTNGTSFAKYKNVGRRWALNEIGTYSHSDYSRGKPFDFTDKYLGKNYIARLASTENYNGNDYIGIFPSQIMDALAGDEKKNSIRYKLEFSVDGGLKWHNLADAKHEFLDEEFGIRINEPNLSDIILEETTGAGSSNVYGTDGYDTDGYEINFWSAVAWDKENSSVFNPAPSKNGWKLRVRITCSIQLDSRLMNINDIAGSGMKELQVGVFDVHEQYKYRVQEQSSILYGNTNYSTNTYDNTAAMKLHQAVVDAANKLPTYSGSFEFAKIYLATGTGTWRRPTFMLGDCLEYLDGRGVSLAVSTGKHACIEQIIYQPQVCATEVITADLRTSRIG